MNVLASEAKRRHGLLTKIIFGLVLLVAALYLWGQILPSPLRIFISRPQEIRFHLPDSFDGPFIVIADERADTLQTLDGQLVVTVPATRIVRVRSVEPFEVMHKESWTTIGRSKSVHNATTDLPDNAVALRCMGSQSCGKDRDRIKYFMGTREEAEAVDFCFIEVP